MATAVDVSQMGLNALPEKKTGLATWPSAIWGFCRRKPLGAVGGIIIVVMLFVAIFVDARLFGSSRPLLAPVHYDHQQFGVENQGPSLDHFFGTDRAGRDIFSRILYGARISAIIAFSCVIISSVISLMVGTISGYFGGWFDTIIQRVVDVFLAIPAIILLVFAITVFASSAGPYKTMFWIILIVGFLIGVGSIRVIRGATIATSNNQYVDAARSIGATDMRIVFRHIVPNVIPVVIVLASISVGTAILAEATISFLGYGIPPPFPAWGGMLSRDASSSFRSEPLQAVWPGAAIALAVYGYNVFGDALRDVLDPRLRGSR